MFKAATQEIYTLKISSDNLMPSRTINKDLQVKEIHGIVCDIHEITSVFFKILFPHLSLDLNGEANELAKVTLRSVSVLDPILV